LIYDILTIIHRFQQEVQLNLFSRSYQIVWKVSSYIITYMKHDTNNISHILNSKP